MPAVTLAQDARKGIYGNVAVGYGSYSIDLYSYAGGRDIYNDQTFSGFVFSLGIDKKNVFQKDQFVFDVGGELTGGLGIKVKSTSSGNRREEQSGGHSVGIRGMFKSGYLFPDNNGAFIPLIGIGPYFTYINTGGSEGIGNYIYGLQASLGLDCRLKTFILTPEIHFGLASWGASDELEQNGQPRMFEIKLKIARHF